MVNADSFFEMHLKVGILYDSEYFLVAHDYLLTMFDRAVDCFQCEVDTADGCHINSAVQVFGYLLQLNRCLIIIAGARERPPGRFRIGGWRVVGDEGRLQTLEDKTAHPCIITSETESDCQVLMRSPEIVLEILLHNLRNFRIAKTSQHLNLLDDVLF